MNPNKTYHPPTLHYTLATMDDEEEPQHSQTSSFSLLPEIVVFRDEDEEDDEELEEENEKPDSPCPNSLNCIDHDPSSSSDPDQHHRRPNPHAPAYVDPDPHISTQFYTFNTESHALMIRCIIDGRLATPDEIRRATPRHVLKSWRSVWKDRNEDTAYLTAWKRIQDKLNAQIDGHGNPILFFKNNPHQCVSHINQWQDIVTSFHGDADLKHFGLKETLDRIKQVWTVGAKFYGIPESFIRVCIASCPVCSDASGSAGSQRSKRRRFEYTESFEVPATEVPRRLQQLAAKHKVVLCIRQKYIRYKPFMAEVKDYACHRAGEPVAAKKSKVLKREPYASKRCGCGFRIRAIVPISNYNEKDKTFVYREEGMAVFKLYAVHSGHEPGPLDGNARIIHRVVGHKGGFSLDQEAIYGLNDDTFGLIGKDEGDSQFSVLQQVHDLRVEVELLEGKITKFPREMLDPLSQELSDIINRLRTLGDDLSYKQHSDEVLVGESELAHWGEPGSHHGAELIEEEDDAFDRSLRDVAVGWDEMRTECSTSSRKVLMRENCKSDKWLKDFDEKNILDCEDSKLIKPLRHDDEDMVPASLVGIQLIKPLRHDDGDMVPTNLDGFYAENAKWYDSPCGLDPGADSGDGGFRHGGLA